MLWRNTISAACSCVEKKDLQDIMKKVTEEINVPLSVPRYLEIPYNAPNRDRVPPRYMPPAIPFETMWLTRNMTLIATSAGVMTGYATGTAMAAGAGAAYRGSALVPAGAGLGLRVGLPIIGREVLRMVPLNNNL